VNISNTWRAATTCALPFARPEDIGPETVAALTAACMETRGATALPIDTVNGADMASRVTLAG
jgi:hypothetical protein